MAKAATAPKTKAAPVPPGPALKMVDIVGGDAKKALSAIESTKGVMHLVSPSKLRIIPGFNIRVHDTPTYQSAIQELKNSIMGEGFYSTKPLSGYVGKDGEEDVIYITDGHRRHEAVTLAIAEGAEIPTIPVILKDPKTSMVDLNVALITENSGAELTMLEKAIVVKRLLTNGMDKEEIAKRLSQSPRSILDLQTLIESSKIVRNFVRDGRIAATKAIEIVNDCKPKTKKGAPEPSKADRDAGMKKAEEKITALVAAAAAKGKTKASTKDEEPPERGEEGEGGEGGEGGQGGKEKVRTATHEFTWAATKGQSFDLKEIRYFKNLMGDNDWFEPDSEKAGFATALEDVTFKSTVKRPKKEDAPAPKETAEEPTEASTEDASDL